VKEDPKKKENDPKLIEKDQLKVSVEDSNKKERIQKLKKNF